MLNVEIKNCAQMLNSFLLCAIFIARHTTISLFVAIFVPWNSPVPSSIITRASFERLQLIRHSPVDERQNDILTVRQL